MVCEGESTLRIWYGAMPRAVARVSVTLLSGVGVRCRVYVWLPVCKRSETEKAENVKGKMSQTAIKADSYHGTVKPYSRAGGARSNARQPSWTEDTRSIH